MPEDEPIEVVINKIYADEELTLEEKIVLKEYIEDVKSKIKSNDEMDDSDIEFLSKAFAAIGEKTYLKQEINDDTYDFNSWNKYQIIQAFIEKDTLPDSELTGYIVHDCVLDDKLKLEPIHKMELIKKVKNISNWTEQNYVYFVDSCLKNKSLKFDDYCNMELIENLSSLSIMQTHKDFGDGLDLSMYERYLYAAINEPTIQLNDFYKTDLISHVQNFNFTALCLRFVPLPPERKEIIITSMQKQEGMTREKYLQNLLACIQNSKDIGISDEQCHYLASRAKDFKPEEEKHKEGELSEYAKFIAEVIGAKESTFDSYQKESLISGTEDLEFIKRVVYHDAFDLNMDNKISLITNTKNKQFVNDILKDNQIESIGHLAKASIIMRMAIFNKESKEKARFIKGYIENEEYHLLDADKVMLIKQMGDKEYTKQAIETFDFKSERKRIELVISLKDKEFAKAYLNAKRNEMDINNEESLVLYLDDEKENAKWNSRIHQIDNISELNIRKANELPDDAIIRVYNENTDLPQQTLYTKKDYITILEELNKRIGDIEPARKGDSSSELKTFLEVYQRLAEIPYDEYAISREGEEDEKLQRSCRNLGCLLENEPKCVCAGYAELLRNALAQKGLECKYISGVPEKGNEAGHAWNQVKIGDNWYNIDLTWDRNKILEEEKVGPEVLKTDAEFENHRKFSCHRTSNESKCYVKIKDAIQKNAILHEEKRKKGKLHDSIELLAKKEAITKTEIAVDAKRIENISKVGNDKSKNDIEK